MSLLTWSFNNKLKSSLRVLQGNAEFTKLLYKSLENSPGNLLFSPISLHAILSLVAQGSAGVTREAFEKVLHVPDINITAKEYHNILTYLNSVTNVTLHIANNLFLQEDYKLVDTFNTIAENKFLSNVKLLNFTQSQNAAITINSWVEEVTNGKINNVVNFEDFNDGTSVILVNAVYFNGKWKHPFKPTTITKAFYTNSTDTIEVEMMHLKEKFYFKDDEKLGAKVLELPYRNEDFSLIIILPRYRNEIAKLEKNLLQAHLFYLST